MAGDGPAAAAPSRATRCSIGWHPLTASILQIGVRRRYRKGVYVVHAGDPGDTLHLILKGRVAVQIDTDRGGTAILAFLGEGSCFGELALLRGGVRARRSSPSNRSTR